MPGAGLGEQVTGYITVSFLCNNRHGHNTGKFDAVDFDTDDGLTLGLYSSNMSMPTLEFLDSIDVVVVSGERYPIRNYSHQRWHGNMAWDAVDVPIDDARRLFDALKSCGFEVESCDCGHPMEPAE